MKLFFDHNLSPRLVRNLTSLFPGSIHVRDVDLQSADDFVVWTYARHNGFAIVSKDSDFHQLSFLHGHPPKVVWIRRGNCSTDEIESILRRYSIDLSEFDADPSASYLALT